MPHMEGVSKEVMIFLSSVATYNSSHQKFGVQFVTPDEQKIFVDLIAHRMNMLNPFDNPDIEYDFPLEFPRTGGNTHFESVKLGDLTEEKRIEWTLENQVPEGDTFPFLQMCLGKYRNDRGQDTLLHARQHELLQPNHADDFSSPEKHDDWAAKFFSVSNNTIDRPCDCTPGEELGKNPRYVPKFTVYQSSC